VKEQVWGLSIHLITHQISMYVIHISERTSMGIKYSFNNTPNSKNHN
jgi:hypothetical protein